MALIERGRVPSDRNFQIAFMNVVGDLNGRFDVPREILETLENDLVLEDALEAAGVNVDRLEDDEEGFPMLELTCAELQPLLAELNDMYLDGDQEAGSACESLLNSLGFEWV